MKWKTPVTEYEWEEYLSAYMDGELSGEEKTELDKLLESSPERASRLEELRKTSGFLKEWEIDTPVPEATFIREVRNQAAPEEKFNFISWFRSFKLQRVVPSFLAGMVVGILTITFMNRDDRTIILYKPEPEYVTAKHSISPSQADVLLTEVYAEGLKEKILNKLKQQNIKAAFEVYKTLKAKYPDSQALKNLSENRRLRFLQEGKKYLL